MTRTRMQLVVALVFATGGLAPVSHAQCPIWQPGFEPRGLDGDGHALAVFDDGLGATPALYVGGAFSWVGALPIEDIARYDALGWSALPTMPLIASSTTVRALTVWNDGSSSQPALFAGLAIANGQTSTLVARFDGVSWSYPLPFTSSGIVESMVAFDDGTGEALYLGGSFATLSGTTVNNVIRWDGTNWSAVGGGVTGGTIHALAVYDDGNGAALYAGGSFTSAGGAPASRIARWDGASWSALGAGTNSDVHDLHVHDDGSGPSLFVAGAFSTAGGATNRGVARWDGASWHSVGAGSIGGGTSVRIGALQTFDEGSGQRLVVHGFFGIGSSALTKSWDGATWTTIDACASSIGTSAAGELLAYDDGTGEALYAVGAFTSIGCANARGVAKGVGGTWTSLVDSDGTERGAGDIAEFHDTPGQPPSVCITTSRVGDAVANGVAKWNGSEWEALGNGLPGASLFCLAEYDDGDGAELYVGGYFGLGGTLNCIARWDGVQWAGLAAGGLADNVNALEVFDDGNGPRLYAGGVFQTLWPNTNVQTHRLAAWDGTTWHARHLPGEVRALHTYDDGAGFGERLFIAGNFSTVEGVAMGGITAFDGVSYRQLAPNAGGTITCMTEFDDGTGPALYFGGNFSQGAGIAKWDGTTWTVIAGGLQPTTTAGSPSSVRTIAGFDDGTGAGPALFVGGTFTSANTGIGSIPMRRIAKWDGALWRFVDQGIDPSNTSTNGTSSVSALHVIDDGPNGRPALLVAGQFQMAGFTPSSGLARLPSCDVEPGTAFCFGDGSLATPCPCAPPNVVPNPSGAQGAGCANSFHLSGGKLEAHGFVADDSVTLRASDLSPFGFVQFFVGDAESASGIASGDGLRCADGALVRFGGQFADFGTARYPRPSIGLALPLSAFGVPSSGGPQVRAYQALYRNPAANFCNAATLNVTNAYRVTWN